MTVRIVNTDGIGKHTRVYIDGVEQTDVTQVTWRADVDGLAYVTATFAGAEVDIVGEPADMDPVVQEQRERLHRSRDLLDRILCEDMRRKAAAYRPSARNTERVTDRRTRRLT